MGNGSPVEIATEMIRLVEQWAPPGGGVDARDRNDQFLVAAYGRAFRCFRSIRDLAARGEADDSAILTRALLSVALRSLWLVQPDDSAERHRRAQRAARSYFEELRKAARSAATEGVEGMMEQAERMAENVRVMDAAGIAELPNDHDLAQALELGPFYTRVYRPGSDVAHYSIGAALDGFLEVTHNELIGPVALNMPSPEKAQDVLIRGCLTYGVFLEKAEPVIPHGQTDRIRELLLSWFDRDGN